MRLSPVLLCCLLITACAQPARHLAEPETITLYCYRTLAEPACYVTPDTGREGRLIAVTEVPATAELRLRQQAATH